MFSVIVTTDLSCSRELLKKSGRAERAAGSRFSPDVEDRRAEEQNPPPEPGYSPESRVPGPRRAAPAGPQSSSPTCRSQSEGTRILISSWLSQELGPSWGVSWLEAPACCSGSAPGSVGAGAGVAVLLQPPSGADSWSFHLIPYRSVSDTDGEDEQEQSDCASQDGPIRKSAREKRSHARIQRPRER